VAQEADSIKAQTVVRVGYNWELASPKVCLDELESTFTNAILVSSM